MFIINSGNSELKRLLSNIPPHPVGQASLEKTASGFDHSSKIIIDIPLYVTKNLSGV
jgi:hypothetical protein